jgi:hypothetical protein
MRTDALPGNGERGLKHGDGNIELIDGPDALPGNGERGLKRYCAET